MKGLIHISQKYNWWTKDKTTISRQTQIENIFLFGTLDEIIKVFNRLPISILRKAFESIKNNSFSLSERRKYMLGVLLSKFGKK